MGTNLDNAIIFATKAHSGTLRKGHKYSYIVHPLEVVGIISKITEDEDIMAAGVLHDVVEDCGVEIEEIEKLFGSKVARIVADESEPRHTGENKAATWKARKEYTIKRVKDAPIESKIVCLADKLSNMRSIYSDYLNLGDGVWDRFNNKNVPDIKWYYESIREALSALSDTCVYNEFSYLIDKVFN